MQSSAQEVTMLFKLIAAAKDSWACFFHINLLVIRVLPVPFLIISISTVSRVNTHIVFRRVNIV